MKQPTEQTVNEARKKNRAGDFKRRIVSRRARDLYLDELILECGHTSATDPELGLLFQENDLRDCPTCAQEWIDSQDR